MYKTWRLKVKMFVFKSFFVLPFFCSHSDSDKELTIKIKFGKLIARRVETKFMFVYPSFVFYPKAQHRNRLEIKSLIRVELSLALSGFNIHFGLYLIFTLICRTENVQLVLKCISLMYMQQLCSIYHV